jgi:hypothetical protein
MSNLKQKIIFSSFDDDFLRNVVKDLYCEDSTIHIKYLNSDLKDTLGSQNIINARFLARENSLRKYYGNSLLYSISEIELSQLNECQLFFNRITDRVFLKPESSRKIESYFNTLISFWFFTLSKKCEVKAVFFGSSPHFPWDVCLFFVAKLLGIKTYILKRTLIEDCVFFDVDFRSSMSEPISFDESFSGLSDINHMLKTYGNNSYWLNWSKSMINKNAPKENHSKLFYLSQKIGKLQKFLRHFTYELSFSKDTYFQLSKANYIFYFYKRYSQQKSLLKYWEQNCLNLDDYSNNPLVYFPLHFQPERSTDPEAGVYSQQILVIKILLDLLPEDWIIVVKEHPRQNSYGYPNFRRFHFRSHYEYKLLFDLPRVVPISVSVPSEKVLNCANLTASCTGSILWEGMLLGIPSISFGSNWHSDCASSPHIDELLTSKVSLKKLLKKTKSEVKDDVKNFIINNQFRFINSSNSSQFAAKSKQDRNLLITNLRAAIKKLLEI